MEICQSILPPSSGAKGSFVLLLDRAMIHLLRPITRLILLITVFTIAIPAGAGTGTNTPENRDLFLVLLVSSTKLDYADYSQLARNLTKRGYLKGGFVGHSWVYLHGWEGGREQVIETGLSPKGDGSLHYFRGVLDLAEYGYVDPTPEQRRNPRHEPNPISYLWRVHQNGHLHSAQKAREATPTFAARVDLTETQYREIKRLLDPALPDYNLFQLNGQQCSSFVARVAATTGLELEHKIRIEIPSSIEVMGKRVRLWEDPQYSSITLSSPDMLERSLRQAVSIGRAREALGWYQADVRNVSWRTF